ncbi:MAG: hypothetical protein ACLPUO_25160 [Streptosporangiaceae bacterium]
MAAASRYGIIPSGPIAPRTAWPSIARAGSMTGPATGKVTGPVVPVLAIRYAPV